MSVHIETKLLRSMRFQGWPFKACLIQDISTFPEQHINNHCVHLRIVFFLLLFNSLFSNGKTHAMHLVSGSVSALENIVF